MELGSIQGRRLSTRLVLTVFLAIFCGAAAASTEDADARYADGVALSQSGQIEEALRVFSDLTRDYPDRPEPWDSLSTLFLRRQDYSSARVVMETFLRLHPGSANAHEKLSQIYTLQAEAEREHVLSLTGSSPATAASALNNTASQTATDIASATQFVKDWASIWSRRDADAYLALYAQDFKPAGGLDRAAWASERRQRIGEAARIAVDVSDLSAERVGQVMQVRFTQRYRSDRHRDSTRKVLELSRDTGQWQIVFERSR